MSEFNNIQWVVVLLLVLDEDSVVEVFKYLFVCEVQEISQEMVLLGNIFYDQMCQVLDDFYDEFEQFVVLNLYFSDYICLVLIKVLGNECVFSLFEDIFEQNGVNFGIDVFNLMEVNIVFEMICDEYLQIIVIILVYLEWCQVVDVLEYFDDKLCNDVVLCIVIFSGV